MTPAKPQNIYDNPEFFAGYAKLRENPLSANMVIEQPALRALLPSLNGLAIMELGCGAGGFARYCAEQGAAHILAVDVSARMLAVASEQNSHPRIRYLQQPAEELVTASGQFDLVVSSFLLHYTEDLVHVIRSVHTALKPGGTFIFSVEHPVSTCTGCNPGWMLGPAGERIGWLVDRYSDEGVRHTHWFVDGVLKYHRTVQTYVNTLLDCGFSITRLVEPQPTATALEQDAAFLDDLRHPWFLILRARKEQE